MQHKIDTQKIDAEEHSINIENLDADPDLRDRLIACGVLEIVEVDGERVARFLTPDSDTFDINQKAMIRILQNVIGPPAETGLHAAATAHELVWMGLESLMGVAKFQPHVLRDLLANHRHVMAGGKERDTAH